MKITESFQEITQKAVEGVKNFPLSLLWAFAGTFYTLWFIEQKIDSGVVFQNIKIILTFILGLSWLIGFRLLFHYFRTYKNKNWWWLSLIGLVFLLIYYYQLPDTKDSFDNVVVPYRFVLYLIAGHLFVFFAPFIFYWEKNVYWNYLRNVATGFITSLFFSLILYLGLVLAILAIKYLFHVHFDDKIFFEIFVVSVGIVNTWMFLAHIPVKQEDQKIHYSKVLEGFVKYILIPLSILYILILYAYSLKIVIRWRLPKGWVSYLIIALSVLGFLIHILINPIRKNAQSKLIRKFYPWFYYALFPMLILFFVAIGKRITDYGFTEKRYIVLILALWITGMSLYLVFSKGKQLRYIPFSLSTLALIISFGFWGIFQFSIHNQARRFKKLYTGMQSKGFKITYEENNNFISIIRYLQEHKAMGTLTDVLGYNPETTFSDVNYWNITERLSDTLHIQVVDAPKGNIPGFFQFLHTAPNQIISLNNYDYMLHYTHPPLIRDKHQEKEEQHKLLQIVFDSKSKNLLYLIKNTDTLHEIKLKSFLDSLGNTSDNEKMPIEKMSFVVDYKDYKLKFLFHRLEIMQSRDNPKEKEITNMEMSLLVKEKNNSQTVQ